MTKLFQTLSPYICGNNKIRTPQQEAYNALSDYANNPKLDREVGIVLPVGCGKSGCITITPFAFKSKRTLVIAPNLHIAEQLVKEFNPSNDKMFYQKCDILQKSPFPEPVEIRGTTTNVSDLNEADVVVTNIQQLQGGSENRWLSKLQSDFFDLIIFDEGHHSVAGSYNMLKNKFTSANIVNFSATPLRADGQLMAGNIIYSYPIFKAIEKGYVKQLRAISLDPRTLRYVRIEDNEEIEVDLEEVRRLGETDADFRRSIVTSTATLNTIVDASIKELNRLRKESGDNRLKIIASALNFEHCRQIVTAYRARSFRADYVHSKEDSTANEAVMNNLTNHKIDVIVQVRKLGEGFDHPFLSVAAVFSIFSNLSPFVQFVGRIMRVIEQNSPNHILNKGVVIFHAGANIANRWVDFQNFSEADQSYFDQLLPSESKDPNYQYEAHEIIPIDSTSNEIDVRSQSDVYLQEIPLLQENPRIIEAFQKLQEVLEEEGCSEEDREILSREMLTPIPTTKASERQAKRNGLDMRVKTAAGNIMARHNINPAGYNLDEKHLGKTNFVIIKSAIDSRINSTVGKTNGQRHEFSREELDTIDSRFDSIVKDIENEVINGTN